MGYIRCVANNYRINPSDQARDTRNNLQVSNAALTGDIGQLQTEIRSLRALTASLLKAMVDAGLVTLDSPAQATQ